MDDNSLVNGYDSSSSDISESFHTKVSPRISRFIKEQSSRMEHCKKFQEASCFSKGKPVSNSMAEGKHYLDLTIGKPVSNSKAEITHSTGSTIGKPASKSTSKGKPYAHVQICVEVANEGNTTEKIQKAIDNICLDKTGTWKSSIIMNVVIDKRLYKDINILKFTQKSFKHIHRVYFETEKYPFNGGFESEGFTSLVKDLGNAAIQSGFPILRNGKQYRENFGMCQQFICARSKVYSKSSSYRTEPFRKVTYNNNGKNSRGKLGRTYSRKNTTMRPLSKGKRCKFGFLVGHDDKGFYLVPNMGTSHHNNHSRLNEEDIPYPARLLNHETLKVLENLTKSNANLGVAVNFTYQATGHMLSRQNIYWLAGLCNNLNQSNGMVSMDSTEKMVHYLKENKFDHMILYQKNSVNELWNDLNPQGLTHLVNLPDSEKRSYEKYVLETRKNLKVSKEDDLMVALAWVLPKESNYFRLFPETIFVDVICDVNKDKRPLFTATGKDANGTMFTFLRAFLPNQQGWIFRWIFAVVFPILFPKQVLEQVQLIVSDGDAQEFQQIDDSLPHVFPNAFRQRCAFHIVRMGWKRVIPCKKSIPKQHHILYDNVCKHLKTWIYSWMKCSCETKEEYEVSKHMFFKFLNTKQIRLTLGITFVNAVEDFIRKNVEVHEKHYAFYLRKHKRHFDETSNSLHEGTNNQIRHSAASINPSMKIENTMLVLNSNSDRSLSKKLIKNSVQCHGTKLYSLLKCSSYLVDMGYAMVQDSWFRKNQYQSIALSPTKWLVIPIGLPSGKFEEEGKPLYTTKNSITERKAGKPIDPCIGKSEKKFTDFCPRFKRVRTIELVNNELQCSCCYRKRFGIGCPHEYHIVCKYYNTYDEPSHHECSVRWWSCYSYYGTTKAAFHENDESNNKLLELFYKLQKNDLCGLPVAKYHKVIGTKYFGDNNEKSLPKEYIYPKFPRCLNYPNLVVYPHDLHDGKHMVRGLTQCISQYSENDTQSIYNVDIEFGDLSDLHRPQLQLCQKATAYSRMKPFFLHLSSCMEDEYTEDDINLITDFLEEQAAKFLGRSKMKLDTGKHASTSKWTTNFVSSTIPCSKKRKPHGTKY